MNQEIILKIRIESPTDTVLDALTKPDHLTRWLAREATMVQASPLIIRLGWPHHAFDITYRECCSERIEIDWGSEKGVGRELSIILSAIDNATIVTLMHRGFADTAEGREMFLGHIEGWTFYLCNLKAVLERDFDMREHQPKGSLAY